MEPPTKPNLFNLCHIGESIHSVTGDILNFNSLKRAILEANPEIVIHMAAQSLVSESYLNPRKTFAINVMGTGKSV